MTDSQNKSAWNEWANYLLAIVKRHDGDLESIKNELKTIGIQDEKIDNILKLISENKKVAEKLTTEVGSLGLKLQKAELTKLDESEFDDFYANDYNIFKTQLLTSAKMKGMLWGSIAGGSVTLIGILLRILLNV